MSAVIEVGFLAMFLASIFLAKLDSHRRNREWDFDPEREALRRALRPKNERQVSLNGTAPGPDAVGRLVSLTASDQLA